MTGGLCCYQINVHFTTVDWTTQNGPLRIIPGTQRNDGEMPSLRDEPAWMKKGCALCPLPAGTAIVSTRAIPATA